MFRRRHPSRPSVTVPAFGPSRLAAFFGAIGWTASEGHDGHIVTTPGGRFRVVAGANPSRMELALSVADPLHVDELAEVVDAAGGITMEPLQETVWGGWGFSFNDPEGNTWEIGSPWTVTALDLFLTTGVQPPTDGPIVALVVPRPLPRTA